MPPKNFVITELRILPECAGVYRKILKEETYHFNQLDLHGQPAKNSLEQQIFGRKVTIQAIVGKNGSGKSSILEIMYRIINNFSFYVLSAAKLKRPSAEPIFRIGQLYADLDFIIDDVPYRLMARDRSLGFVRGNDRFFFGDPIEEFAGYNDLTNGSRDEMVALASSFFYTIVTNYSFQSLITQDFSKDNVLDLTDSGKTGFGSNGNWLDSLFRKNDGYVTPIVLNPYRESGKIDLQREYELTLSRMSALLVQAEQKEKELLRGYRLSTIKYEVNYGHFLPKLFDKKKYNPLDDDINLSEVLGATRTKGTVARVILDAYEVEPTLLDNQAQAIPHAYLIYKTLSVLSKYGQFDDYKDIPAITEFRNEATAAESQALQTAIKEIRSFRSHVNTKIHQTLNYFSAYSAIMPEEFKLEDYLPYQNNRPFNDLDDIVQHLPPPFYKQEIKLFRGADRNDDLSLSTLSSGERQFIYTISTIVYHIRNLLSIQQKGRIRYRNINIVLDEVEICFHPEYQRQFIDWLLDLIQRLNLSRACSFNIMLVTHSPFILSDIPKNNILYLEDGKQKRDEDLINPFAANINDILYQSFFLEGGFLGEHAKKQISSAVTYLERVASDKRVSDRSIWNRETLRALVDMIGEPLLKDNLEALYVQAYGQDALEGLLRAKDDEIARLRRRLSQQQGGTQ